jgi:hypothetical protein
MGAGRGYGRHASTGSVRVTWRQRAALAAIILLWLGLIVIEKFAPTTED